MAPSGNHASVQNRALAASPTSTVTEALNMEATFRSALEGSSAQAEAGSVLRSHSQRKRSA
jgi:hypothetical protein